MTYGDLSDTASASVSDTRVFLDCGKLDAGVGAALRWGFGLYGNEGLGPAAFMVLAGVSAQILV